MRLKQAVSKASLLVVGSMLALPAVADAAFICAADPTKRLAIDSGGGVLVDIDGAGIINICSMSSDRNGVTKEACNGWYSTLLTYRSMRAKARLYFTPEAPGNSGVSSCAGLGDWTVRTPYFMEPNP